MAFKIKPEKPYIVVFNDENCSLDIYCKDDFNDDGWLEGYYGIDNFHIDSMKVVHETTSLDLAYEFVDAISYHNIDPSSLKAI